MPTAYKCGRETLLTEAIIDSIIAAIPEVLVRAQVAYRTGQTPHRLRDWLDQGEAHVEKGIESLFSRLYLVYHYTRTETLKKLLVEIQERPKNFQALVWTVERAFREDFGPEGEEMRLLRDEFKAIRELITGNREHGNGEKIHTENAHEKGGASPGASYTGREENSGWQA